MITKQLIYDIITFCNNYIDNKNIVFKVAKFPKGIYACFSICKLCDKDNSIDFNICSIDEFITNEKTFDKFKEKVLNQLPLALEQIK